MKKKILIVEDNKDVRNVETWALEKSGYEVIQTSTAQKGISLAKDKHPDLILMDIRLPYKKKGIGAARIIRHTPETSHIPIIFVTGYSTGEHTKEIQNISNCTYITKPFDIDTLLEEVKKLI